MEFLAVCVLIALLFLGIPLVATCQDREKTERYKACIEATKDPKQCEATT